MSPSVRRLSHRVLLGELPGGLADGVPGLMKISACRAKGPPFSRRRGEPPVSVEAMVGVLEGPYHLFRAPDPRLGQGANRSGQMQ